MGKNWKGRGGGGGGGGNSDLSSSRGFAAVLGTCDAAREKESNKELANLLNQAIEREYPQLARDVDQAVEPDKEQSIADMLQNELKSLQKQKHSNSQDIITINTGIKGIVFAKISRRDVDPVRLIKSILDQVREEKVPCSRHLVKIIPLQLVYFAGEEDFINSAKIMVEGSFQVEEGSTTLSRLSLSKVVHNKRKVDDLLAANASSTGPVVTQSDQEGEIKGEAEAEIRNNDEEGGNNKEAKRICVEHSSKCTAASSAEEAMTATPIQPGVQEQVISGETAPPPVATGTLQEIESALATSKPLTRYFVIFKARNHNTLNKQMVIQRVREVMPSHMRQDYLNGENAVLVEALKNVAGISYFPDFYNYSDLNLRKHQAEYCPQVSSTMLSVNSSIRIPESADNDSNKADEKVDGGNNEQ